ncbi:MAG TPA: hypothetical protein VNH11_36175, partial [Pirellulales bacterium]|nr:hypothetical protein [Pirellulales bacterium]
MRHACRLGGVPPETNGPPSLAPRAAHLPTVALSLEREESRLLRAHATRVSPRRVPPETNGPQALRPRAAKVPTVALSLEREESR